MSQSKHTPGPRTPIGAPGWPTPERVTGPLYLELLEALRQRDELCATLDAIVARADAARGDGTKHIRVAVGSGGWMDAARAAIARARGDK